MNQRIRERREAAGLSIPTLTVKVCQRLPEALWMTSETLRRYETTKSETKADPLLIIVLADVLGCKVSDLSPKAAEALEAIREVVMSASRWKRTSPDQLTLTFGDEAPIGARELVSRAA